MAEAIHEVLAYSISLKSNTGGAESGFATRFERREMQARAVIHSKNRSNVMKHFYYTSLYRGNQGNLSIFGKFSDVVPLTYSKQSLCQKPRFQFDPYLYPYHGGIGQHPLTPSNGYCSENYGFSILFGNK